MQVEKSEALSVQNSEDVVRVRQAVRNQAIAIGLSLVDQTKVVTAASEIARNTIDYGGGGMLMLETVQQNGRRGVRMIFTDHGPGIPDIKRALEDGYTTGNGLGLGLSGAKRLCSEFNIETAPNVGTKVSLIRWK